MPIPVEERMNKTGLHTKAFKWGSLLLMGKFVTDAVKGLSISINALLLDCPIMYQLPMVTGAETGIHSGGCEIFKRENYATKEKRKTFY